MLNKLACGHFLFRIFEKEHFNYLDFMIIFPRFGLNILTQDPFDGQRRESYIEINTGIRFIKEVDFYYFSIALFGFGFAITRQWGY